MRAVQSSSTAVLKESGVWCRSEQFAALRYMSRHLETDAAGCGDDGSPGNWTSSSRTPSSRTPNDGRPSVPAIAMVGNEEVVSWSPEGWNDPVDEAPELARYAAQLLLAMQLVHKRLADESISFADWTRYSTELESLLDRSWELMARFLHLSREDSLPNNSQARTLRLEKGAAGWIAC